ncbi:MAG TPA: serine/threonine-protein kinase, partial [Kofleriaceae bacterium]|nr:serine/threonine-protein kinase [Kofleriaceae bacterium]
REILMSVEVNFEKPYEKLVGQVLASRYQIESRIGEGAMGAVYRAKHVKVGRAFAVKVLHSRLLEDKKVLLRFEREAELAGRLRHPNVIGVVDVGETHGLRYMVMDFAEGPDLAQKLSEAPMPPARIIHLVRQMLEGLYHAHEQGLIHRDFKPENVIIEHDTHGAEMPRIVDFGIAILRDGGESADAQGRLTTNGLVLGTPHYMAPEQAVADPIDHRIDLFALGIVIYEMLSGRLPFDGNGAEVARANLLLDPPPIVQRVPYLEVDPLLEAFARRLMEKKPKARPATAKAARELLDLIARDRAAAAAALGVPLELCGRAPAETTPLPPAARAKIDADGAARTRRLRATPSPTEPMEPPLASLVPTTPPLRPPPEVLAPMPVAYSARRADSQPVPSPVIAHETSVRAPLSWPGTPLLHRRRSMIIAAVAVGTVVLVVALVARLGAKKPAPPDPSGRDDRIVMAPIAAAPGAGPAPAPTTPVAPAAPPTTPGTSTEPTTPPADPAPASAPSDGPRAVAASPPDPRPAPKRRPPRDLRGREVRAPDLKARAAKAGGDSESDVTIRDDDEPAGGASRKAGAPGTAARPVEARPAVPASISPTELSNLWRDVGTQLGKLPRDKSQDLWSKYELLHYGTMMSGTPAQRDEDAAQLRSIAAEASRRSR